MSETIEKLIRSFENFGSDPALISDVHTYSYQDLAAEISRLRQMWEKKNIQPHDVVVVCGDFNFSGLAVLLSLAQKNAIVLPQTAASYSKLSKYFDVLNVDAVVTISNEGEPSFERKTSSKSSFLKPLIPTDVPGLVVFTSGSTGVPKGIVHNFAFVCEKFLNRKRSAQRAIPFLLFDHFGGINTALSLLSTGGCIVQIKERTPQSICAGIEKYKVSLLPTTPTFLNLLLISEEWKNYDLSSLQLVTYGTEVMSEVVLKKWVELFPHIRFKQTYGLSETGVMASTSRSNDTTWIKIGGEGYDIKILDGILWIKAKSKMLGCILFDGPEPRFEPAKEEWFCTQDIVEQDGEWLRFKGRNTDIINVSGLKVYPSEIESCLLECNIVGAATVGAKKNALIGQMIVAQVQLKVEMPAQEAKKQLEDHCKAKLEKFKVPHQFIFTDNIAVSDRFKKVSFKNA